MNRNLFANIQLLIFVSVAISYFYLKYHFSGVERLRVEVSSLKQEIEKENVRHLLTEYQFEKYRQYVAAHIPKFGPGDSDYPVRTLASISRTARVEVEIGAPKDIILEAKTHCEAQRFQQGQSLLTTAVERFPLHPQIIEAHFLLQKCYFDGAQLSEGIHWTEMMVQRFPESELTGLALLRSGDAYLERNRLIDAKYVFEMVKTNFKTYPQVVANAAKRLSEWQ